MKTILVFDTDDVEDEGRLRDAQAGRHLRFVLSRVEQELRSKVRHAPDDQARQATAAYEVAREMIRNELDSRDLLWVLGE